MFLTVDAERMTLNWLLCDGPVLEVLCCTDSVCCDGSFA